MRTLAALLLAATLILPAAIAEPIVGWTWVGGVTDRSAVLTTRVRMPGDVRLQIDPPDGRIVSPTLTAPMANGQLLRFELADLKPATEYRYRLLAPTGEPLDGTARSLRTFPEAGQPASFRFAFGACAKYPDSPVFAAAARQGADFFLHTGDFHYSDISENLVEVFRSAYDVHLSAGNLRAMLERMPLIYQWDDHDFGPNDSNQSSPSREASRRNYRELVPHYPLADPGKGPTDQAFTVGRVRFILSDLRSERDPKKRRMMNAAQDRWLKNELLSARGKYPLIFWVSSVPWNGPASRDDRWQGYAEHRAEIANFIKENRIPGVSILAGDAHMTAIDDGTNGDFADGGGAPLRIFQAAPISNRGSYKGGPYSHGARAEGAKPVLQQFGLVDVKDDGREIRVTWSGRDGSDGIGDRVLTGAKWGTGPIELSFQVP